MIRSMTISGLKNGLLKLRDARLAEVGFCKKELQTLPISSSIHAYLSGSVRNCPCREEVGSGGYCVNTLDSVARAT